MRIYTFYDFLSFSSDIFNFTFLTPFQWLQDRREYTDTLFKNRFYAIFWLFGIINTVYMNIGLLIYYYYMPIDPSDWLAPTNKVSAICEWLSLMCYMNIGTSKYIFLYCYRKRIAMLIKKLNAMFPDAETQMRHAEMYKGTKNQAKVVFYRLAYYEHHSRMVMKRCASFVLFLLTSFNLLPLLRMIIEFALTGSRSKFQYQTKTWYPWQKFESTSYSTQGFIIAYICQFFAMGIPLTPIIGTEFIYGFFITQLRMHFDFLASSLYHLDARSSEANEKLKNIIKYHNRLLELSKELNSIFNVSFLINLTTSSLEICLASLCILSSSIIFALQYATGTSLFVVMNYYSFNTGYLFIKANDAIMPAALYSNWYEGNQAYRHMLTFFIMRTSSPQIMRVYGYVPISLTTYMQILKTSYQLIAFFHAMS